jgi:predicted metal-dependent hydrolase
MVSIDKIIRSKRKTLLLVVQRDGKLLVRAPLRAPENFIHKFVLEKEKWIRRKQEQAKSIYPSFKPKEYLNGEAFWYLGKIYRLQISENPRPNLAFDNGFELSRKSLPKAPMIFERWYRAQAQRIISERVLWYAAKHGFNFRKFRVTSARTRWGSCSSKGTLSFSWRLVMAPIAIIDYVVIHELVHLQEKNHSRKFWSKVQLLMPDYKKRIEWLHINGHLLNL